ncbi:hypothetical protein GX586_01070 [bacterium]|nr:hypothetical protein [bacterium]
MKNALIAAAVVQVFAMSLPAADSTKAWTRIWGTPTNDFAKSVCLDAAGNAYVSGWTEGGFDGHANLGRSDAFFTKFSPGGGKEWTRLFGSAEDDNAQAVAADAEGHVYVTGYTGGGFDGQTNAGSYDLFLKKYDAYATAHWTRIWGGADQERGEAVSVDRIGGVYVAGWTTGEFDGQTNPGSYSSCLTKYNAAGEKQASRIWGAGGNVMDGAAGVCAAHDGAVYVCGWTDGPFDGQAAVSNRDAYLCKFSSWGERLWTRIWGATWNDEARAVSIDSNGFVYVAGGISGPIDGQPFAGATDLFLRKYAPDGSLVWMRIWGSADSDEAHGIGADEAGNPFVAGLTFGGFDGQTNAGGMDACLTAFYTDGTRRRAHLLGGPGSDWGNAVAATPRGDAFICGGTQSSFDGQTNAGYATWDPFLTQFLRPMTNLLFTAAKGSINTVRHLLKIRVRHDEALPLMFTNDVRVSLEDEEAGLFTAGDASWKWNRKGTAGTARTPAGDKLKLKQAKADKRQILVTLKHIALTSTPALVTFEMLFEPVHSGIIRVQPDPKGVFKENW